MNEEQEKEILNEAKIQTARHKKKIQIISLVAIIAVIAMATVACIPLIKALHSKAGIAALERKLDNYSGIVGVLIFTFIQALQVLIMPFIPPRFNSLVTASEQVSVSNPARWIMDTSKPFTVAFNTSPNATC